jgi:hypothetical protein
MPDTLTPWRDNLTWQHCHICNAPIGAYLGSRPPFQLMICHSCTGFHPHILGAADLSLALEEAALELSSLGQAELAAHYQCLAERERARPPLRPLEPPPLDLVEGIDVEI